jgi:alcohol dehydrogenase
MDDVFVCPVKTHCGLRALEHIPYELGTYGACKPLLLCDETTASDARRQTVIDALRGAQISLVVADLPSTAAGFAVLEQLAAIYRDKDCDAILALGSEGVVNAAKLVNLMVSTGSDELEGFVGIDRISGRLKPLGVIASAAASGFETSGHATWQGLDFRSVFLMPELLFLDSRTVGHPAPEALTEAAFTALALGAEILAAPCKNPMRDIFATNAVQMAARYLHGFVNPVQDVEACLTVANASAMGGCSLGFSPLGLVPLLARGIAGSGRLRMGAALAVLLPYAAGYGARHLGWQVPGLLLPLAGIDVFARTPEKQRLAKTVDMLCSMVNGWFERTAGYFPRTLAEAGFSKEELTAMAETIANLAPGVTAAHARAILQNAWQGQSYPI